jgi:hypothetical protein
MAVGGRGGSRRERAGDGVHGHPEAGSGAAAPACDEDKEGGCGRARVGCSTLLRLPQTRFASTATDRFGPAVERNPGPGLGWGVSFAPAPCSEVAVGGNAKWCRWVGWSEAGPLDPGAHSCVRNAVRGGSDTPRAGHGHPTPRPFSHPPFPRHLRPPFGTPGPKGQAGTDTSACTRSLRGATARVWQLVVV